MASHAVVGENDPVHDAEDRAGSPAWTGV
jgi:hypothetical protein